MLLFLIVYRRHLVVWTGASANRGSVGPERRMGKTNRLSVWEQIEIFLSPHSASCVYSTNYQCMGAEKIFPFSTLAVPYNHRTEDKRRKNDAQYE